MVGFAASSPYPQAVVWTAAEQGIVLAVPTCALAEAWSKAPRRDRDALKVLRSLPVTVMLDLDEPAAHDVGLMLSRSRQHGKLAAGHVTWCAQRRRGWPVVTGEPRTLLAMDSTLEIDRLPLGTVDARHELLTIDESPLEHAFGDDPVGIVDHADVEDEPVAVTFAQDRLGPDRRA